MPEDRTVLRIVNDAFGLVHVEDEDTAGEEGGQNQVVMHSQHDSPDPLFATWKRDHDGWYWHWPSDLHLPLALPSATSLLWLMSRSASKEEWRRGIRKLKTELPSSCIASVKEMEKYWLWLWGVLRGDVAMDVRTYVTPVSVSLALGAVGVLVLIPRMT